MSTIEERLALLERVTKAFKLEGIDGDAVDRSPSHLVSALLHGTYRYLVIQKHVSTGDCWGSTVDSTADLEGLFHEVLEGDDYGWRIEAVIDFQLLKPVQWKIKAEILEDVDQYAVKEYAQAFEEEVA